MLMPVTRRTFVGSAAASAASMLSAPDASAQTVPISVSGDRFLRIGVVTCHPTHHHMPNIWGPLINCTPMRGAKYAPTRMTGMKLTHIWDLDPERVKTYSAEFGTEPVRNYDAMVGKVDGVIISDMRCADVFPELARPYLEAGIPILFNHLAGS
jgi:hypothetical protein